ncbi:MAG TPA: hypothetical protein VF077_03835 [Nitrospiraceae bacterium]
MSTVALKLELDRLREILMDIEELVDGEADVDDGRPNVAMQVLVLADMGLDRSKDLYLRSCKKER